MDRVSESIAAGLRELIRIKPTAGAIDGRQVVGFVDNVTGGVSATMGFVHEEAEAVFLVPLESYNPNNPTQRVQAEGQNFELVGADKIAGAFWQLSLRKASRL